VPLEAGTTLLIMARISSGKVERVRAFSDDCPLDAGGRTVRLIDGVTPDASVRWLADLITATLASDPKSSIHNSALSAIGSTAGAAADAALSTFTDASQPSNVRRQAIFWIGQARGAAGFATLKRMLDRETAVEIRRTLVQAISRSRLPEAAPALIAIAKNDKDPATRGEALFWLAQNAGRTAAAEITAAVQNDPDTNVQVRAVQALSQLPKDEGVPRLIDIARSHKNPKVRERAMFWLGQSKDPRAAKFFEEILIK
jgi:HEAT repeat protein